MRETPTGHHRGLCGVFLLLVSVGCAGSPAPETATPDAATEASVAQTGSFTDEQVAFGRETFDLLCDNCHSTTEFRGQVFQYAWRRQTAWDFYVTVGSTMPDNAPGTLSDRETVSVVAWVLSMNGFEPGASELAPDEESLSAFVMDAGPGELRLSEADVLRTESGRTFGHVTP